MNKSQKIKYASRRVSKDSHKITVKKRLKDIILFPWRLCKAIFKFIISIFSYFWAWLKSLDMVGMINLTLLVCIIVLFAGLIGNVTYGDRHADDNNLNSNNNQPQVTANIDAKKSQNANRKVVERKLSTLLPAKVDKTTGLKPQIKVVGVKKPVVVKELSLPAKELPKQKISGDVIVDSYGGSPVLSNGVSINGNLYIQNMHKYTLPCDAKIKGNLFIRNVSRLRFCGGFTVMGNIYVNRDSSFGPIPENADVKGQIIL